MNTRQFLVTLAVAVLVILFKAGTASAQGTVTWVAGFPAGGVGKVDIQGAYTVNPGQGWIASGANFTWTPASGGTLTGVQINHAGGWLGKLQPNGQIGIWTQPLAAGTYQGWLTVAYDKHPPLPTGPVLSISTVLQFTVN